MTDYGWPPEARTKHLYVPGSSGYGKTTLMANLAIQDICETIQPIIAIDPKGGREGLVERILPFIPARRVDDVVYISLDKPVALDLLSYSTPREKSRVTEDIITILQRFSYGSWGPAMQGTLRKLIPTLLEAPDATFLDIGAFLEIKRRRDEILEQVSPERAEYWKDNEPKRSDAGPIASRIANFEEEPLRTFVQSRRGEGLNIEDLIEENKIILVDTSPRSDDGMILGALIMSRIQQAIFRRKEDLQYPCCQLYVDEFHNFVTSAFNVMLSQARSFNLSLCLANQHPKQIPDIWDDIVGCVSSYMIFRMDGTHATMLRSKIKDPLGIDRNTIKMMKFQLEQRKAREDDLATQVNDLIIAHGAYQQAQQEMLDVGASRRRLEQELKNAEESLHERPPSFIDDIPSLPIGAAIYVSADGNTQRIQTAPLPPYPAPNFAQAIKDAQSIHGNTNRTGDNSVLIPTPGSHAYRNEKPEPEPGPAIQSHEGEKKRS
jgi:hypothetical protein